MIDIAMTVFILSVAFCTFGMGVAVFLLGLMFFNDIRSDREK